jgi:hypothetical protein
MNSGYIWGDTATLPEFLDTEQTPIDAARALDRHLGVDDRHYEEVFRHEIDGHSGYLVYEANENIPVHYSGDDQEIIDLVDNTCQFVCALKLKNKVDEDSDEVFDE